MKLNWGTGIAIFYGIFVVIMVIAVVKSSQLGVDLVQEKYYDADIAYESFRVKRSNALSLEHPPQIQVFHKKGFIELDFESSNSVTGTVKLYCPSDKYSDKTYKLDLNNGHMQVPIQGLKSGRWKIILDWEAESTPYYMENDIVL
jgi:hypothetical protein